MEKREPLCPVGGNEIGTATMENNMEFPQKIKNGTALWPSDSTSGNISEETQNANSKEYMSPYVHCNIIYNSQDMDTALVPINRWVDKKVVVHLHDGILLVKHNLTICDNINGPREYYAKWIKSDRVRQIPYDLTYYVEFKEQN